MPYLLLLPESALMEILISERLGFQFEHNTSIRTYHVLFVSAASSKIFKISATSDSFHKRIEHHHGFGTDPLTIPVDRAAMGTGIFIADFLSVSAIMLRVISPQKTGNLYLKFIFFRIPFFHRHRLLSANFLVCLYFLHRPIIVTAGGTDKIASDTASTNPRIVCICK